MVAADPLLAALAAVAFGIGVWVGLQKRNLPAWRAVSVGISMNVLAWGELERVLRADGDHRDRARRLLVFVFGIRRRPQRIRRVAWIAAGAVGRARRAGRRRARARRVAGPRRPASRVRMRPSAGSTCSSDGEFALAADQFEAASASLRRAEERLDSPWVAASSVVPVVVPAPGRRRSSSSAAGSDATARIAAALRQVDPAQLRVAGRRHRPRRGRRARAAVRRRRRRARRAVDGRRPLPLAVAGRRSSTTSSTRLAARIADNEPKLQNARDAVALAPGMLGGDGPRTYLVLFTTPAEARGLGGFAGNYAELTIDHGAHRDDRLRPGRTTSSAQAEDDRRPPHRAGGVPRRLRHASASTSTAQGLVGDAAFRNLTMTPELPLGRRGRRRASTGRSRARPSTA